jgi:hypothetical protein
LAKYLKNKTSSRTLHIGGYHISGANCGLDIQPTLHIGEPKPSSFQQKRKLGKIFLFSFLLQIPTKSLKLMTLIYAKQTNFQILLYILLGLFIGTVAPD